MPSGPLERIRRELHGADLVELMSGLAPTDLQSVLLEVYRRHTGRISPPELLRRYEDSRFVRPSVAGPAALARFETSAWSTLPEGYEAVELSPLCPLGTSSAVATVDQNKVVSTVRNVEVVGDSTNVLTLEAAIRRRELLNDRRRRFRPVGLAACQRQVRAQPFARPRSWAHFRLLGVVEAGRDQGSFAFEADALCRQITYFASLLAGLGAGRTVEVAVTDLADQPRNLEDAVIAPLAGAVPGLRVRMDPGRASGRGYYIDACYKLLLHDRRGVIEVGDGGCTDWTRRLLSDGKERLVIGGLSVERLFVP